MSAWDANLYLRFGDERTRAARDLLAQVPLERPQMICDLGCGPGNSTELLAARFPGAEIVGVDNSAEMLAKARQTLPRLRFVEGDLATWRPEPATDLLFANAVFQWLPDHPALLQRLLADLSPGGVLAVQMPDNLAEPSHVFMSEVADMGPWASKLAGTARDPLPPPSAYYDVFAPLCSKLEIWHSIYNHVLADAQALVDWVMGTGLRPFLVPLDEAEREAYLAAYKVRIAKAYPPRIDGRVLFRFPRLFIVAVRG